MMRIETENFDLKQIADSGQCFRMTMADDTTARVIAGDRLLFIKDTGNGTFELSCERDEYDGFWHDYFDLGADYSRYIRAIDSNDRFLKAAADYGRGIRILRQEPFETLITFIISQRKNIPAIQASVEKLCRLCGDRIGEELYGFPSPDRIAGLSEEELAGCSLGYRVTYVREAARRVAEGGIDLVGSYSLEDDELLEELMSFYGVGRKVANCVMLFAYHRIGAFPVDVWIQRVADRYYGGRFPSEKYPGFAGILQQYMFFYAREASQDL